MNCYIETLSLFLRPRDEEIYHVADKSMLPAGVEIEDVGFPGRQTNEAPTKYIIWKLAQEGKVLDKIFVFNTKETIGMELPHIQKTTYQYYCESIIAYIDELSGKNDFLCGFLRSRYSDYDRSRYNSAAQAYFYDIVVSQIVREEMQSSEWKGLMDSIFEYENIDIYFDYTGGSRVASLMSMFTVRIAEIKEARIKQVIYSDINNRHPRIVDLTQTYCIMGDIVEFERAQGTEKQVNREHQIGKKLGWIRQEESNDTELYDKSSSEAANSLKKKSDSEIKALENKVKQDAAGASGLSRRSKEAIVKQIKVNNAKSVFLTLLNKLSIPNVESVEAINWDKISDKSIEVFIASFYEEIIDAFCEAGVMDYHGEKLNLAKDRKESIKKAITSNSDYYLKTLKSGSRVGLIPVVQRWLRYLKGKGRNRDPIEVFRENCDVFSETNKGRSDRMRYVVGVSKELHNEFIEYLSESGHDPENTDVSFSELFSMQLVFFNYGFPFALICNGKRLKKVESYYLDLVEAFMRELSRMKNADRQAYFSKISRLCDDNNTDDLIKELPCLTEMEELWSINEDKLSGKEKEAFVQDLSRRLEKVRPYRNANAHKNNDALRDRENQIMLAKEIISWLIEYDSMFSG